MLCGFPSYMHYQQKTPADFSTGVKLFRSNRFAEDDFYITTKNAACQNYTLLHFITLKNVKCNSCIYRRITLITLITLVLHSLYIGV